MWEVHAERNGRQALANHQWGSKAISQQPQRAECCQQPEKEWIPSPRALEVRPQPLGQNLDGTWSEAMKLRISGSHPWNYARALISGLVVLLGASSLWEESLIVWWVLRR